MGNLEDRFSRVEAHVTLTWNITRKTDFVAWDGNNIYAVWSVPLLLESIASKIASRIFSIFLLLVPVPEQVGLSLRSPRKRKVFPTEAHIF